MLTDLRPIKLLPPTKPEDFAWPKNYLPKQFDWLIELQELANGKPITNYDHEKLRMRAGMWPTCACGQLCQSLPRTEDGRPVDGHLFTYGYGFYTAVKERNWSTALYLFNQIEARTQHLLNEQRIILDSLQSRG